MTALPWQETGLPHRVRDIGLAPSPGETCYLCNVAPVALNYADAGLCDGCGDHASHEAEQARIKQGRDLGLDVTNQPGRRPADVHFPMRRI